MKYIIALLCLTVATVGFAQSNKKGLPYKPKEDEISDVVAPTENAIADTQVYTTTDETARPGYDLMQYLFANTRYADDLKSNGIQGTVLVRFVINKDGTFSNFELLKKAHAALNDEAIRVLKTMPKWTPARIKGAAVRSYYVQPISFRVG